MEQINRQVVNYVARRFESDGLVLSDRVWRLAGDERDKIASVLRTDILRDWLVWGPRLSELHEKTIRYMQARSARPNFAYDRNVVKSIGTNYANEMRFVLPLPDNRQELVNLLTLEMDAELDSQAGAMNRLG